MNSIKNQIQFFFFSSLIFFICILCIVGYFHFPYISLLASIIVFHILVLLLFESLRKQLQQILFILLGIFIPTSIAISNFLIVGLVLCWISEWVVFFWILVFPRYVCYDNLQFEDCKGNVLRKINYIKESKWIASIFALIILYGLGMFWGNIHENWDWQFQRLALLLFFPILATIDLKQKTLRNGAIAFLITNFISAVAAILINCNIILDLNEYIPFITSNWRTSAFIKYNYHNVLLALSSTLSLYILLEKKTKYRNLLLLLIATYALSIFTERGRAGQVIFNLSALFYIIYYNRKSFLKLTVFVLLLFSFQYIIYNTTKVYKIRFDAVSEIIKNNGQRGDKKTKDIRYVFIKESLNRIFKKPIFGYGTGSFGTIFKNEVKSGHKFTPRDTPHNQYLYVWFELGIAGLALLLLIFYHQLRELLKKQDGIHRSLLPFSFLFLMLVDSYFFIFILTIAYIYLYTIYSRFQSE